MPRGVIGQARPPDADGRGGQSQRRSSFLSERGFWRERDDVANDDPMMASVPGRYASALFELANDERKLADVELEVGEVQRLLDTSEDLRRMVRSPVISSEDQGRAIAAIAAKAGLSPLMTNFLKLLARNRRLFALAEILRAFRAFVARHRGEVTAESISAMLRAPKPRWRSVHACTPRVRR